MSAVQGWPAAGAGLVTLGLVLILGAFHPRLVPRRFHRFTHPWAHRLFILLAYAGATALLVTSAGHFITGVLEAAAGLLSGFGSGWGRAAIIIAGVFLILAVCTALVAEPGMRGAYYAVLLVFVLALVPGGFLHAVLVTTAAPGRAWSAGVAVALGGVL